MRWIVYGVALVFTGGKLKFWILPNLDNEKTGFFESFMPFYSVEWVKEKKKLKKKAKAEESQSKESDDEASLETKEEADDKGEEEGECSPEDGDSAAKEAVVNDMATEDSSEPPAVSVE